MNSTFTSPGISPVNQTVSTEQNNKRIIDRMHRVIALRGLSAQADFFAEYSLNYGYLVTRDDIRNFVMSRDEIRSILQDIQTAFPDFYLEPHELIAEGELVTVRYTMSGTHKGLQKQMAVFGGVLTNIIPTGKHFRVQRMQMFRFKAGQIIEHTTLQDNLEMARQLGVTLEMKPPIF
jgi:predicted ester cyclase